MIRVVFVLQEPTPYRTPHLDAVARRDELDVTVVYASQTLQRREWDVPEASKAVRYLEGPSLPAMRLLHHDYALTPQVWPLLGELDPDVVVVGGWSVMATQLAVAWARVHRVPYLLMSDNHLLEPRPSWVRAVKRVVLRGVVPQAAGWLVPGSLARQHVLHYGAKEEGTIVFPLTIDVDAAARRVDERRRDRAAIRARLGVPDDAVLVLHVGRLIGHKGVDVLVSAIARARHDASKLHLLVIGSGPEEEPLSRRAEALGAPVTWHGFAAADEIVDAYAAADVFALLSRRETWGVVVNEAAAAALPLVLSTSVGASADLLEPGANGMLVRAGDDEAAAAALVGLAADGDLRTRYGSRSRELVRPWTYEPSVDALARFLAEVVR